MQTRTLQEVRRAFEEHGLTVAEWAQAKGFKQDMVYAVLLGRARGLRGEAHKIALALGLKGPAQTDSPLVWLSEDESEEVTQEKETPMADG